jgi:hypothetical protein
VRTGLVVLGTLIAVIGAGLIIVLFVLSGGSTTSSRTSFADPALSGHSNQTWTIAGPPWSGGSISIVWTTSADANVTLIPATSCVGPSGFCPVGPAVLNWTMATSGKGTVASTNASLYVLRVMNSGGNPLTFSAQVSVTYSPGVPFGMWIMVTIIAGGVTLLVIGGVALFLGLFLPGGVYRDADAETEVERHPSLPPEESGPAHGEQPPP